LPHRKVTIPIPNKYLIVWNMFNCSQNTPKRIKIPAKENVLSIFYNELNNSKPNLMTYRKNISIKPKYIFCYSEKHTGLDVIYYSYKDAWCIELGKGVWLIYTRRTQKYTYIIKQNQERCITNMNILPL
jgi:hypothetical protein